MIPVNPDYLCVEGLEKRFGRHVVLRGIDLSMAPGRVTAVLGPNGSGKTTLIKILLGLVRPDGGRLFFNGERLDGRPEYRARIGYMPQTARFPEMMRGRDILVLLKQLRGPGARLDEGLISAFDLESELDKPLRTLSGGNRQKVSAAVAFLFDPDVLILDEPTAGLDPVASGVLKDKILRAKAQGKTILLTSHIMSEVEELADDVAYLVEGRVRFAGRADALLRETGQGRLERALAHLMQEAAA